MDKPTPPPDPPEPPERVYRAMTVGELRAALSGLHHELEITVRVKDDSTCWLGPLNRVGVETEHGNSGIQFVAFDCCAEDWGEERDQRVGDLNMDGHRVHDFDYDPNRPKRALESDDPRRTSKLPTSDR